MRYLLLIVLILAACGAEVEVSTTTTTTTPTTEATIAGTTTTVPANEELPDRGLVWDLGTTYSASEFVLPLAITPVDEGWRSSGATPEWVNMTWVDPDSRSDSINLLMVLHQSNDDPALVIESILENEFIEPLSNVARGNLAGLEARSVDVEGLPDLRPQTTDCSSGIGFFIGPIGLGRTGDGQGYGVPHCGQTRIWVVEAGGVSVTLLASTLQVERFDELILVVERLLQNTTFDAR